MATSEFAQEALPAESLQRLNSACAGFDARYPGFAAWHAGR